MTYPIAKTIPVSFPYKKKYSNGTVHKGVDFSDGKEGHKIYSCLAGKVTHAGYGGWGSAYGQHVIVESVWNGKPLWMIYAHLKTEIVAIGQTIKEGQQLGTSGGKKGERYSGNSTGPHVHVQACTKNVYTAYVDPWPMINHVSKPVEYDNLDPKGYGPGKVGKQITWLGGRIDAHRKADGLKSLYKVGPGPEWGAADLAGVKWMQGKLGFKGKDADGLPGTTTLKALAADPKPKPPTPVPAKGLDITAVSANLAAYDVKHGKETRIRRIPAIAKTLMVGKPMWLHLQECSSDMVPHMDKALKGYKRIAAGGKGRESYYRADVGITIQAAALKNVKHMLKRDTKEFLVIVWSKDGYHAVDANFHNENEGTSVQKYQLNDVMREAVRVAESRKIDRKNVFITGDTNRKESEADLRAWKWTVANAQATARSGDDLHSTNGWRGPSKGRQIDIDASAGGVFKKYAQVLTPIISDHYPHRTTRVLVK